MTVNNNELLPCPFCGGEVSIKIHDYSNGTRLYTPKCKCGAGIVEVFHTEAEAIAAWNTRTACDDCQMGGVPATEENMAKYGWVKERTCHWIGIEEWKNPVECSECGVLVVAHVALDSNYCCNCGARVVEE